MERTISVTEQFWTAADDVFAAARRAGVAAAAGELVDE